MYHSPQFSVIQNFLFDVSLIHLFFSKKAHFCVSYSKGLPRYISLHCIAEHANTDTELHCVKLLLFNVSNFIAPTSHICFAEADFLSKVQKA